MQYISLVQIIELCNVKGEAMKKAHAVIDSYAERGLRSLAVARQVMYYILHGVSEKKKVV